MDEVCGVERLDDAVSGDEERRREEKRAFTRR
jgi:hypothetical protein